MVHVVEANMDASVTITPLSHVHKLTITHVLNWDSHVPTFSHKHIPMLPYGQYRPFHILGLPKAPKC